MALSESFLAWEKEALLKWKTEGLSEGLAEGKAEGKAEERKTIAHNLLRQNIPVATIAQATGLTIDEVQALGSTSS